MRFRVTTLCAVVLMAASCQSPPRTAQPSSDADRVPLPADEYRDLAWLPNDWLVVSRSADPADVGSRGALYRFREDSTELQEIEMPPIACDRTDYLVPTALPDGRLGAMRRCWPPEDEGNVARAELIALDVETGDVEVLADLAELGNVPTGQFTWDPAMERGFLAHGSGVCQSILAVSRDGVDYPAIEVSNGTRSFTLDEMFDDDAECEDTGQADFPAWSPDGEQVAFFASPEASGVSGFARFDVPHGLYVLDPDAGTTRRVVAGVLRPGSIQWLPDSGSLAFVGTVGGTTAMWTWSLETAELQRIGPVDAWSFALSPDASRVAYTVPTEPNDVLNQTSEIRIAAMEPSEPRSDLGAAIVRRSTAHDVRISLTNNKCGTFLRQAFLASHHERATCA